ncbi:hypothetical protein LJC56_01335 [Christensenellaceae bacterium OttesenSCG-928-K19]|nr:hypothetical protein [Christensenellaceae bacterium OttesenSCG-928-K19]
MVQEFMDVQNIEFFLDELDKSGHVPLQTEDLLLCALADIEEIQMDDDTRERLMYRLQYHLVRLEDLPPG